MSMKNLVLKRLAALKKLLVSQKVWRKPPRKEILVFDAAGVDMFLEYFDANTVEILYTRSEQFNMYVVLKCLCSLKISFLDYLAEYIEQVSPRLILTLTDNNYNFYLLKIRHPKRHFVFIQNGIRTVSGDIFEHLRSVSDTKNCHVDYMLTFGASIGKEFQKYITGTTLSIGSFKSNMMSIPKKWSRKNGIFFVSQYEKIDRIIVNGKILNFEEFSGKVDRLVLCFLEKYASENNLNLSIIGRTSDLSEEMYYSNILRNQFSFFPRKGPFASYKLLDSAEIIVVIDTTMGLEALAKYYKVGMLSVRNYFIGDDSFKFGWPAQCSDNGPFWTNVPMEANFARILNYLLNIGQSEWEETVKVNIKNIIEYDHGNMKFRKLMENLGIPLKRSNFTPIL